MDAVELDAMPDLGQLLARAGAGALPSLPWQSIGDEAAGPGLPDTQVVVRDVPMELAAVADYADVCGFRLRPDVPVTFPAVLGFPLSVWLMTHEHFSHPLLGLVHLREQIVARAPIPAGARVDLAAHVVNERTHRRGVQFDVVVQARRDDRVVWASTSTHLRRGASLPDAASVSGREAEPGGEEEGVARGAHAVDLDDLPMTARWRVPAEIGRRYAAVSGDRNPIHLTAVTAKAFGFPRAIAHGMWTTAAALAGLGSLPRPCTVDVAFRRPLLLPSTVEYATLRTGDGWDFGVRGVDGTHHLVGRVT